VASTTEQSCPKSPSTVSFASTRIYEVTILRLGCPQTDVFRPLRCLLVIREFFLW
jgi:hypothetical protein